MPRKTQRIEEACLCVHAPVCVYVSFLALKESIPQGNLDKRPDNVEALPGYVHGNTSVSRLTLAFRNLWGNLETWLGRASSLGVFRNPRASRLNLASRNLGILLLVCLGVPAARLSLDPLGFPMDS